MTKFEKFLRNNYFISKNNKNKDQIELTDVIKGLEKYYIKTKQTKCPKCHSYMISSIRNGHACITCEHIF